MNGKTKTQPTASMWFFHKNNCLVTMAVPYHSPSPPLYRPWHGGACRASLHHRPCLPPLPLSMCPNHCIWLHLHSGTPYLFCSSPLKTHLSSLRSYKGSHPAAASSVQRTHFTCKASKLRSLISFLKISDQHLSEKPVSFCVDVFHIPVAFGRRRVGSAGGGGRRRLPEP